MALHKAIIDFGTNSIKTYVYNVGVMPPQLISSRKHEARLGEKLAANNCLIAQEQLQPILSYLRTLKEELVSAHKVEQFACFGTEIFRVAANSSAVLEEIKSYTGLTIQVLSHADELAIYWQGLIADFPGFPMVAAIDIGGGTVQFMYGSATGLKGTYKLKTGALVLRDKFISTEPPTVEQYLAIEREIYKQIENINLQLPPETPFVHGSSSVLDFYREANMPMEPLAGATSHPYKISLKLTQKFYERLRVMPVHSREKLFPSHPRFTDGASIGLANLLLLAEATGLRYEVPSNYNIVNGLLLQ